jgi:hypothetical protein
MGHLSLNQGGLVMAKLSANGKVAAKVTAPSGQQYRVMSTGAVLKRKLYGGYRKMGGAQLGKQLSECFGAPSGWRVDWEPGFGPDTYTAKHTIKRRPF